MYYTYKNKKHIRIARTHTNELYVTYNMFYGSYIISLQNVFKYHYFVYFPIITFDHNNKNFAVIAQHIP